MAEISESNFLEIVNDKDMSFGSMVKLATRCPKQSVGGPIIKDPNLTPLKVNNSHTIRFISTELGTHDLLKELYKFTKYCIRYKV